MLRLTLCAVWQNASVLENHHWRMAVGCVADSGMLSHLEAGRFSELMAQIRSLILATDIARQSEFIAQFQVGGSGLLPSRVTERCHRRSARQQQRDELLNPRAPAGAGVASPSS